jgi:hypothetical protein
VVLSIGGDGACSDVGRQIEEADSRGFANLAIEVFSENLFAIDVNSFDREILFRANRRRSEKAAPARAGHRRPAVGSLAR